MGAKGPCVHKISLSTQSGQGNIVDNVARTLHHERKSFDRLRRVPFVKALEYTPVKKGG